MNKARAIDEFWEWFSRNRTQIEALYESKRFGELSSLLNTKLNSIDKELPWEIGPGVRESHSLTLSPEGNARLRALIDKILAHAPPIKGWEFYSSRQPRSAPATVRLPERGLALSTEGWRFVPNEDSAHGRIDLTIVDAKLGTVGVDDALRAATIFLDQYLGERAVEEWLGRIQIAANSSVKTYPIGDLPDYILWATHRKDKPLSH